MFIPKIPSYRITDVAKAIAPNAKIKIIGIRPGEKLHEEMITETDSLNTIDFDNYYVIMPSTKQWDAKDFIERSNSSSGKMCEFGFSYNSGTNQDFLSVDEIKSLIKENLED